MEKLRNDELNVTGGWQPAPVIVTHELYYLTDEQIAALLKMGWHPGDEVYVRFISTADEKCSPWMKLTQVIMNQYPVGAYRVEFIVFPA